MKNIGGLFCFAFFLLLTTHVSATTRSSLAVTGSWSSSASWSGGILPVADDTVYIVNGANITLDQVATVKAILINTGGTLNIGSQTLTLTGVNDSIGNVSLYGTLNLNTGIINLTGIWNNSGTFNCGSGTVNFDGGFEQAIEGSSVSTFFNLHNNNPNTTGTNGISSHPVSVTIKGNFIQNGQFHRNSNGNPDATVIFDGNTTLSGAYSYFLNHVIINAGATLNAGSKTIYLYGNWTNNGTFLCGTGTLRISQDTYSSAQPNAQYVNQPMTQPFYNLYISKSTGSIQPGIYAGNATGNLTVNNDFTVNNGTWNVNGTKNLTVLGDFVVNSSGGGVFSASTGNVYLTGGSLQILSPGTSTLYNLQITNSGAGIILGSNATISNTLQLVTGMVKTLNGTNFYELYLSNNSPSALLAGYTSTNFIQGKFRRALTAGAGTYVFPIGPVHMVSNAYRPVTLNQTASGGATDVLLYEDTITAANYKANWWLYMQPTGGNPTGTITNLYNLATDFPAGTIECSMSLIRGAVPPPAAWVTPLATTTGASSGSITTACPGVYAPFAYIIGEPILTTNAATICSGNTASLSTTWSGGSGTIRWYDAASGGTLLYSGTNYTTTALTANTTFYATIANAFTGCETHRTPLTVTVNALPTTSVIANTGVCAGNSIALGGASVAGNTYSWTSNPVGFTSASSNPTVSPAATTTYYLTQNITATGCTNSAQVIISIDPLPVAPTAALVDQNNFCSENVDSITLSAANGSGTTLNWYTSSCGSGSPMAGNNLTIAAPSSTTTFYAAWENGCGVSTCQSIIVTVLPSPAANAGNDVTICESSAVTLNGSGGSMYSWSTSQTTASITFTATATDTLVLTVAGVNGCTDTDTAIVTVNTLPVAIASPDTSICPEEQATLTASGGSTYSWDTGASTASIVAEPTSTTIYSVTVTNANGCSAVTSTQVIVLEPIEIFVTSNPSGTILTGQLATFMATPDSLQHYNFYINGGLAQSSSSNMWTTNDLLPGDVVTVSVETGGCPADDRDINPNVIEFYNSFTPNRDGLNDVFLQGVDLTIVNRWGQELYHGNEGWDGSFGDDSVSQGTYFFIVKLLDENGIESEVKGSVTLIR
ncbi:MAG: hypothetical protein A2W93_03210 [Bacteroidetes bacterium GWF2_43_63]|nr:MAG: hypothetical protein A2W94_09210 [Bacteroidetes bacterium GWE2_42_42]OFY53669.1 MAG: hypothetical protein A2W93_03210 [Bacteroidetes bacterium GWF2_43_63]HBG70986.1 hypothetical protein [Bacteroidales bacterium]HCB62923.1 hypothetical protein [Bacteroidales bacterium]HCY24313.1 hypothetical protein [Bacteroidales bacterium]